MSLSSILFLIYCQTHHLLIKNSWCWRTPKQVRSKKIKGLGHAKPHQIAKNTFLVAQLEKNLPKMQEARVWFLGWEDPLEKEMAIHSSTLAWKIPWMEEPDRLQSWGRKESDTTEWLHFIFTPALQEDSLPSEPPGKSLQVQAKIQISYDILNFPVLGRKEQKRTISSAQPLYPAS